MEGFQRQVSILLCGTLLLIIPPTLHADDVRDRILQRIRGSHHSIDLIIYRPGLAQISNALLGAQKRGVSVRLIIDQTDEKPSAVQLAQDRMLKRHGIALKRLHLSRYGIQNDKFLLLDGRSVALASTHSTVKDWPKLFQSVVAGFRSTFGQDLPIVWAQIGPNTGKSVANGNPTRESYLAWAMLQDEQLHVHIPNTAMVITKDEPLGDGWLHFSKEGSRDIGRRMYQAWQRLAPRSLKMHAPADRASLADEYIVAAGQSNNMGWYQWEERDPFPDNSRIVMHGLQSSAPASTGHNDPAFAGTGNYGPSYALAMDYVEHHPDVKLHIIQCSVGGTSIETWQPGADQFDNCVALWHQMGSPPVKLLTWVQGESDTAPNYNLPAHPPSGHASLFIENKKEIDHFKKQFETFWSSN